MLFSSLSGCSAETLWGRPVEQSLRDAAAGNLEFIEAVSPRRYPEALKAGAAAPWALGALLERGGDDARARAMYAVGAGAKRPKPGDAAFPSWALSRWECLRALVRLSTGTDRLQAIRDSIALLSDSAVITLPEFSAMDAVSLREDYGAAENVTLLELGRAGEINGGAPSWIEATPLSADLIRAVNGLPESALDERSRREVAWRSAVFTRDYQRSWLLASAWIDDYGWPASRAACSDLGKAALYGGAWGDSDPVALFRDAAEAADSADRRYVLLFYAARLAYRSASVSANETPDDRGDRLMALARDAAETPQDRDSASWYLLDSANRRGVEAFLERVSADAAGWGNLSWYADILDARVASLVASEDWKRLGRLREALLPILELGYANPGAPELAARLGYIAARTGLLSPDDARAEYERIRNDADAPTYYRVVAADRLGVPFTEPADYASSLSGRNRAVDSPAVTEFLKTALAWNVPEAVWPLVKEWGFAPPPPEAAEIAEALARFGFHSESIRLGITGFAATGRSVGLSELFYVYPRPWPAEIAAAAEASGTAETLLYALIRSESFFDPGISSVAGAVGLTQLMESTAADMARKQKLDTYDLRDPATNIRLGSAYFGELLGRLENRPLDAVFAYNAGITRLRQWRRAFGNLPDDLFLEGVPYAETREYGRKVLVAAVFYGYLYYRESAERSVRSIFKTRG